ncbi:MAG: 30S ribosomal protein S6 [Clostridiales bacterium]|nr:30S ribosomal protein S6 [Clostridiales bacterium]
MTKYEMLLVLDAVLADDAKESLVKKFEDMITENGGAVEKIDRWGVRKLQYPINYKSEGYYVLVTFQAEKAFIAELERVIGITDGVIRRLITKM